MTLQPLASPFALPLPPMSVSLPPELSATPEPDASVDAQPDAEQKPNALESSPAQPNQRLLQTVKAYYVGYADDSFAAVRQYVSAVDIVAGQWLGVNASGQLIESKDEARNDQVRQIVRGAGKKVYSCVVNQDFSHSVLASVLNSSAKRTAVIDKIVAFVNKKGDDGVDLDFEGIRAGDGPGYTAFVKELAEKLHAQGKELSIAVDATWTGEPTPGFDYKALGQYADSVMPMTYTFGPGRTPIGPMKYLDDHARKGVAYMDPSKFMIGIGVYGRDYNLSTGRKSNPNNATIQAVLAKYAPAVTVDESTITKKFTYTDDRGNRHQVYFDDADTIRQKVTVLRERYGITSVGLWRMGQEDPELWSFLQAASGKPQATASADTK